MREGKFYTASRWAWPHLVAWLAFLCSHQAGAQDPDAAIDGTPVSFFSYSGMLDTSFNGVDQIYRSDAGLTLFLDGKGYGFAGDATEGGTGPEQNWDHLETIQLTPNSYRDNLQIVTGQGNIDISQLISYFPGSRSINIAVTITNNSSADYDAARLIYGADTFINGDDRDDFGVEDFSATRSIGTQDDTPEPLFSGLSGFQSIDDPQVSSMNFVSGFFRTVWDQIRSGALSDSIDSSPRSRDQGIAISFDRASPLRAGESWTVRLQWIYEIPRDISLSSCNVTSPAPQSSHLGEVPINFDGNNSNSNPIDSQFEYSTDGGQTWGLCTAAASSSLSNPDGARITPFVAASFRWDPLADGIGIDTPEVVDLRVSVRESGGGQIGQCIVNGITIERAEPRLSPLGEQETDEDEELNFTAMAMPGLSPTLAFSLEDGVSGSVPTGASIDPVSGVFSWVPSESQGPGVFLFDVVVTGSSGSDRESVTVRVSEVNRPPVLVPVADQTIAEGSGLAIAISAGDDDLPANSLSYSLDGASLARGMSIDPDTGRFTWTPDEVHGQTEFEVTVTVQDNHGDGGGAMDSESFTIAVTEINDPPILANIAPQVTEEGIPLTFTAGASDSDLPAQPLTFALDQNSIGLGMSIAPSTGVFRWTPDELQGPGNYTATITVDDGGYPDGIASRSDSQEVTIAVSEVNRPPVLAAVGNRSVDEQVPLVFSAAASDPDSPDNVLIFSLANGAGGAVPSGALITPTGAFSWTPTEAQGPGSFTFDIVVRDDGEPRRSDSETITVNVANVLDPSTTSISSNINPSVFGQEIVIATTVSPPQGDERIPSGIVELRDGATQIVSKTLVNGRASFAISDLAVETHRITAIYRGDIEYHGGSSSTLEQIVNRSASRSSLSSSSNPSAYGQEVTFNASVSAALPGIGIPSGNVDFLIDGLAAATKALVDGAASFAVSDLSVGSHAVTIEYVGSGNFQASNSDTVQQGVGKAASSTVVASNNNPSRLGEPVTLIATVKVDPPGEGMPTGTVEFLDGPTSLGVVSLGVEGRAEVSLDTLVLGNHPITSRYSGDGEIAASESVPMDQLVKLPTFTIERLDSVLAEGTTPATDPTDLTFTVTKNEVTPEPAVVGYAVVGSGASPAELDGDFEVPNPTGFPDGTLVFGTAVESRVLSIRLRADDRFEPDESFTVTLTNSTAPSLALTSASGTILNDDTLRISIDTVQGIALEEPGSAPATLTVSRNGTDGQSSVNLRLAPRSTADYPADFTISGGGGGSVNLTVTVPEGSSSIELSLTPVDDPAAEASETATLEIIPAPAYEIVGSGSASITIPANDVAATHLSDFDPISSPNGGEGTLRQALLNANDFPDPDIITFAADVNGTLILSGGELLITSDLSIAGPGPGLLTVSGDRDQSGDPTPGDTRVIRIDDGDPDSVIEVRLSGLSIVGGLADGGVYPANAGGGILNAGESLLVDRITVARNSADFGGGIENAGELVVRRSTISNNSAVELGGGIDNFGSTLEVSESTISDNIAGFGGGVENSSTARIYGSTLVRNFAVKLAGGVDNFGGVLSIVNSTVSENESEIGGGLYNEEGELSIVNCTVVKNLANPSQNANVGAGVFVRNVPNTVLHLNNSIIAGNSRLFEGVVIPSDIGGSPASPQSRHNLIGDANSAAGLGDQRNGNLTGIGGVGVRPLSTIVSGLAPNGGPTQTHALLQGSPAIDAGDTTLAVSSDSLPLEFDQRGNHFPRVLAGSVDIGAYEYAVSSPLITSISINADSSVQITWISQVGEDYEVLRSVDLVNWTVVSPSAAATSEIMDWTDPTPPAPRAFYTVRSN